MIPIMKSVALELNDVMGYLPGGAESSPLVTSIPIVTENEALECSLSFEGYICLSDKKKR